MPAQTAPRGANQYVEMGALYKRLFSGSMFPVSEKYRTRFGKGDVMERINASVQQANMGLMLYLTDLGRETLELDPHTNTVAAKRFGAIAELDWSLTPATGPGINEKVAAEICDVIRAHLKACRGLKQAIYDMAWGVFDGRSLVEIDWRFQGGRFPNVPVALDWVHPRRLAFGPHRELCVIDTFRAGVSWWTYNGVPVENIPGKFIRWLPRYFGDYSEREGLLRRSLYWIYFKRFASYERMVFTELFGKPLRVVEWEKAQPGDPVTIDANEYKTATQEAEQLGGTTTATMPRGAKLEIFWPGGGRGISDLYKSTVDDVDSQMSRLWLGNEATTVMMPSGMGSQSSVVQSAEQNIYLERDAGEISDRFQCDLVRTDVLLNWGPDFLDHTPTFKLHAKDELDKTAEQTRLNSAIQAGIPVKVSQYAERTGVEIPNTEEKIIVLGDAGRARIVDQAAERARAKITGSDQLPEVGEITLTPTDMAAVVRVNEARAGQGLGPLKLEDGSLDPDGRLPVSAYRTKMDALFQAPKGAPPGAPGGGDPGADRGGAPPGQGGPPGAPGGPGAPPPAGPKPPPTGGPAQGAKLEADRPWRVGKQDDTPAARELAGSRLGASIASGIEPQHIDAYPAEEDHPARDLPLTGHFGTDLLGGRWIGWVEPADSSWIAFVAADGKTVVWPKRGPNGEPAGKPFFFRRPDLVREAQLSREPASVRLSFDPDQPREPNGQWGSGGGDAHPEVASAAERARGAAEVHEKAHAAAVEARVKANEAADRHDAAKQALYADETQDPIDDSDEAIARSEAIERAHEATSNAAERADRLATRAEKAANRALKERKAAERDHERALDTHGAETSDEAEAKADAIGEHLKTLDGPTEAAIAKADASRKALEEARATKEEASKHWQPGHVGAWPPFYGPRPPDKGTPEAKRAFQKAEINERLARERASNDDHLADRMIDHFNHHVEREERARTRADRLEETEPKSLGRARAPMRTAMKAGRSYPVPVKLQRTAPADPPETPIVKAATREGAKLTTSWRHLLCASVPHEGGKSAIRHALSKAAEHLPIAPFAGVVERAIVRGALFGAARAHDEMIDGGQTPLPPWRLEGGRDAPGLRPLHEVVADFAARNILPLALIVAMRHAAKQRAAEIAELARQDMLRAAQEEAEKAESDDPEALREDIGDRLDDRGWGEGDDSHTALVFAVAVTSAFQSGRTARMDQPDALRSHPIRIVRGIDDAETRPAHRAAHGVVLRSDDPFWKRAPLPWGFSCRCGSMPLEQEDLTVLGLTITPGSDLKGLPDEGFESKVELFGRGRAAAELGRAVRGLFLRDGLFALPPPQVPPLGGPPGDLRPPPGSPALAEAGAPTGAAPDPTPPKGNEVAVMDANPVLDAAIRAFRGHLADGARVGDVLTYAGIPVRVDRPVGFVQTGTGADGTPWRRVYSVPYGEILGTEGGDGEPLDVFCGPAPDAPIAFWAEQKKPDGSFNEFKLGLGWRDQGSFVAAYLAHIPADFLGRVWTQPVAQVKALLGLDPQVRAERMRGFLLDGDAPFLEPVARARASSARAAEASEEAADASRLAHGGTWGAPHEDAHEAHRAARLAHEVAAADHEVAAPTFPAGSPEHAHHVVEAKRHRLAAGEHGKGAEAEQGHAQAKRAAAQLSRERDPIILDESQPRDKDGRWMAGAAFAGGVNHISKIEGPAFGSGKLDPHSMAKWAGIKAAEMGKPLYATPDDRPHSGGFKLATKIGKRDAAKGHSVVHPDGTIVHHNGGAARGKDPVGPWSVLTGT